MFTFCSITERPTDKENYKPNAHCYCEFQRNKNKVEYPKQQP